VEQQREDWRRSLDLELQFGRDLVRTIRLDGISSEEYIQIVEFFAPLINDRKIKGRDAIADTFLFATRLCPTANASDIWHHIIYRTYCREKTGVSPEQSWVRTSGEAFENALIARYNPVLASHDIRLNSLISGKAKKVALERMGLAGRVGSSKVDVLIEQKGEGIAPDKKGWGIVGGVHAKVSLAERISDDIPASRIMMEEGLLSVLVTLDVKSFPPPNGDLVNRGEFGTTKTPSDKRLYIEAHGDFSIAFSYNLRTMPSEKGTKSGKRLEVIPFEGTRDPFSNYLFKKL
jgi:hypothetical protein